MERVHSTAIHLGHTPFFRSPWRISIAQRTIFGNYPFRDFIHTLTLLFILRLIFIDLAGSERATDAQNNQRQTRREGAQINWSLLALKECIRSMDMTHSHAPFRQSKLTHILRDSLVGSKTRTCLMANVSPPNDCCQCSLNTLQYASRIRDISMRHRTRSMPMGNIQSNLFDETIRESQVIHDKAQPTFKPATASTPVHRLIPSTEQAIPTFHFQSGLSLMDECQKRHLADLV